MAPPGPHQKEDALGDLIRSGSPEEISRALHPHVNRVVRRTLNGSGDPDLVVTATSDALLAVCRYRSGFRRESKASTWIHVIASRTARKLARRERARTASLTLLEPESLARLLEARGSRPPLLDPAQARAIVTALVPNETWRRVWLLANDPDLRLEREEIARRTGYTPASVAVILSRVRGRLNCAPGSFAASVHERPGVCL